MGGYRYVLANFMAAVEYLKSDDLHVRMRKRVRARLGATERFQPVCVKPTNRQSGLWLRTLVENSGSENFST